MKGKRGTYAPGDLFAEDAADEGSNAVSEGYEHTNDALIFPSAPRNNVKHCAFTQGMIDPPIPQADNIRHDDLRQRNDPTTARTGYTAEDDDLDDAR